MKIIASHTIKTGGKIYTQGDCFECDEETGKEILELNAGIAFKEGDEEEDEELIQDDTEEVVLTSEQVLQMDYPALKETALKLELETTDQKAETLKQAILEWIEED